MNFSLRLFTFLFVVVAFTLTSCGDDECVAPDVSENIIGSWTVTGGTGIVEFQADGTMLDPNDDIIGGEVNGIVFTDKSYIATNDSLYVEAADPANSSNMVNATFPIEFNECDAITISLIGINIVMTRQ